MELATKPEWKSWHDHSSRGRTGYERACKAYRMAELKGGHPTAHDVDEARRLYERYIRYVMAYSRLYEAEANGTHDERACELMEARGDRLDDELLPYGLWLTYPGLYPEMAVMATGEHIGISLY